MPTSLRLRLLAVVVLLFLATGCAHSRPVLDASGKPIAGAIASMEEVEINGVRQVLLLRGASADLPVLLFVHGGLGTPYSALAHTFQDEWERRFVVVHWEQRGSGKLYCETDPRRVTTDQLLDDTRAVAEYLNRRFGKRVHLVGHSWGSYLAFRTAARYPELFEAYLGVGQTVGILEDDRYTHQWVLEEAARRNDTRVLRDMRRVGPPPYANVTEAYDTKYGAILKYGGFLAGRDDMSLLFKGVLSSPEYSLLDAIDYVRGMKNYEKALLENGRDEIWKLSVRDIEEVSVPMTFVFGEGDRATPPAVFSDYARTLRAPRKNIVLVPKAAHFPFLEQREAFTRILFEQLLEQGAVANPRLLDL